MTKLNMNKINANNPVNIVQQQSVHFLCFYYTGKYLLRNGLDKIDYIEGLFF